MKIQSIASFRKELKGLSKKYRSLLEGDTLTLLAIYDKSAQSTISDKEIEARLNEIE